MKNESGKTISDADKALVQKYLSSKDDESGKTISDADRAKVERILEGEKNNFEGDGFRNGGKVSLGNFKGSF
tara:strand:+ start:209 stop:424 length:216 start_codon:yes stop_codon:yes gene_type:complete